MNFIREHRKFFVAAIGAVLIGTNSFFGVELGFGADAVVNTLLAILTAVGVDFTPNDESEG